MVTVDQREVKFKTYLDTTAALQDKKNVMHV